MKKVLIIANDTTYTYNLRDVILKRLIEEGYEVVVASECINYVDEMQDLGVRLIDLKMNRRSTNPFSDVRLFNSFRKLLKKEKPDVVLTYNIKPNIYGGMACRIAHVPYIPNITGLGTAVENSGITQKISTVLYKIGISKAFCIMFQNEDNRDFFVKNCLMSSKHRTQLLPGSGVNLEKFSYQPYPQNDSKIVLSTIGRIMKDKGTDELLDAIKIVKKSYPDIIFRLIGYFDENYQDVIGNAVNEGLIEYIQEQKDIRPYIQESWAIIQPSHHEGMSNVLLESAATGRPVIASDIPGCRETFDRNVSGYAFPAGDYNSLSEMIVRFINLPFDEKIQMGKAGRSKMELEFDRNKVAQAYINEIMKVEKDDEIV